LKFFFDGSFVIPDPVVPTSDGRSLVPYAGSDQLTVNGELNKLGHNVSFGHGIHAGIHWRGDSDTSLLGARRAFSPLVERTYLRGPASGADALSGCRPSGVHFARCEAGGAW
jgi:hypothetical protein